MTEMQRSCYRSREDGTYRIRDEHRAACSGVDCAGCRGCPQRHCTGTAKCAWHVGEHELTCGRCIGQVRTSIRRIVEMSALMLVEALDEGVDSEAANMAGPAADPRVRSELRMAQRRHLSAWEEAGRITEAQHLTAITAMDDDDQHHPYSVLTRWQMMLAEDYDHDLPARLSIADAADYLDRNLYRIAQDPEQDFSDLGNDMRRCVKHLEVVIRNDTRPDRGAPCPRCTSEDTGVGPRLIRKWARAKDERYDEWSCPRCKHVWSHHDYNAYVLERRAS